MKKVGVYRFCKSVLNGKRERNEIQHNIQIVIDYTFDIHGLINVQLVNSSVALMIGKSVHIFMIVKRKRLLKKVAMYKYLNVKSGGKVGKSNLGLNRHCKEDVNVRWIKPKRRRNRKQKQ